MKPTRNAIAALPFALFALFALSACTKGADPEPRPPLGANTPTTSTASTTNSTINSPPDANADTGANANANADASVNTNTSSTATIVDDPGEGGATGKDAGAVGVKVPKGPGKVGEVCEQHDHVHPALSYSRPCAAGLVCCTPPHGAQMAVDYAFCSVPCKPTKSAPGANAGCSGGCPWGAAP